MRFQTGQCFLANFPDLRNMKTHLPQPYPHFRPKKMRRTPTRWFKPWPFDIPSWRSRFSPLKGHLTIPKRSQRIARQEISAPELFPSLRYPAGTRCFQRHRGYHGGGNIEPLLSLQKRIYRKHVEKVCLWRLSCRPRQSAKTPPVQNWLVVSTHLKNISQNGNLPQIGVKIKNMWNHHPEKIELEQETSASGSSHVSTTMGALQKIAWELVSQSGPRSQL